MIVQSIKTRLLNLPQDDLLAAIKDSLPALQEKTILAVTSKVVSIWQGRCLPKTRFKDKDALIKAEADSYPPRELVPKKHVMLTIKNGLFLPTAGIDETNDYYILWPTEATETAKKIYDWARKTYKIKKLGVIITDSRSLPGRRGTVGLALSHWGLVPLKDYRGQLGLYGRPLTVTQANLADALAAAAVLAMGEGAENTPLAVITDLPGIDFTDQPKTSNRPYSQFEVKEEEDLYYPLLKALPWQKGGGGLQI
jgi:F420-0:gamma-glutamyl ligase